VTRPRSLTADQAQALWDLFATPGPHPLRALAKACRLPEERVRPHLEAWVADGRLLAIEGEGWSRPGELQRIPAQGPGFYLRATAPPEVFVSARVADDAPPPPSSPENPVGRS